MTMNGKMINIELKGGRVVEPLLTVLPCQRVSFPSTSQAQF